MGTLVQIAMGRGCCLAVNATAKDIFLVLIAVVKVVIVPAIPETTGVLVLEAVEVMMVTMVKMSATVCHRVISIHVQSAKETNLSQSVATIPNVAMEPFTVKSVIIPGQLTIVVKNVKEVEMFLSIGKKTVLNVMGKNTFHRKNERNVHAEMARGRFPEMVRLFMLIVPVAKAKDIFRKIQLFHAHIADRKVI